MLEMINHISEFLPPFCHLRIVPRDTPELARHLSFFSLQVPESDPQQVIGRYVRDLMIKLLGQSTTSFRSSTSEQLNSETGNNLLPVLKREASRIIADMPCDYMQGASTMYVIHSPTLKAKIVQAISKLPLAVGKNPTHRRLISVETDEMSYVFELDTYEIDLPLEYVDDPRWLILHLFNPDDPAMELLIPEPGSLIDVMPTMALDDTARLEYAAMEIVEQDLRSKQTRVEYTHEPNGVATFPDFEAYIDGAKWEIEVTRVLTGIAGGRTFRSGARNEESAVAQIVQSSPIGDNEIDHALTTALEGKGAKSPRVEPGTNYCLILVDVANLGIQKESDVWKEKDLSAFAAVIVISESARQESVIEYIKGSLTLEPTSIGATLDLGSGRPV